MQISSEAPEMACSLANLSSTWVLHTQSQSVGWRQFLVYILPEHRHTTLVASRLPLTRPIDKKIVNNFIVFVLDSQLVGTFVSEPADATIGVQRQDVIWVGRGVALQAPNQCYRYTWTFDPAHQLHTFS